MVSSSSSPSPSKKLPKYASSSAYVTRFDNRQTTIFNKARELSTLIDVKVCVICYGLDGDLKTWPADTEGVKKIAKSYIELSEEKRLRGSFKKDKDKKKKKVGDLPKVTYPKWESRFYNYSRDQLRELLIPSLERNYTRIHNRTDVVQKGKGQRNNIDNQELTMNHHYHHFQQKSNQVSFFNYNHGNGHVTQIPPVSASDFSQGQSLPPLPHELPYSDVGNSSISPQVSASAFNQEQSLAPLPPELMMNYPYWYVGNSSIAQTPQVSASALNQGQFLPPLPLQLPYSDVGITRGHLRCKELGSMSFRT